MHLPSPPDNGGLLEHLEELWSLLLPLFGVIASLIVWAWRKMERSVEQTADALQRHAASDETIHDDLYKRQRQIEKDLNTLIGEHQARHEHDLTRERTGAHTLLGRREHNEPL